MRNMCTEAGLGIRIGWANTLENIKTLTKAYGTTQKSYHLLKCPLEFWQGIVQDIMTARNIRLSKPVIQPVTSMFIMEVELTSVQLTGVRE